MKKIINRHFIFVLALAGIVATASSCKDDKEDDNPGETPAATTGSFNIRIDHVAGHGHNSTNFAYNEKYLNANNDSFQVTLFKYYLTNVVLKKADGSTYEVPESYYLVDESKPASKTINITNVPAGEYTGMTFMLGVDSTRNVSGDQTGALDPANDMFWSWNVGYIFLKLEGKYGAPNYDDSFSMHVGGFASPHSAIRTIEPDFAGGKLNIASGADQEVHMHVNVLNILNMPNAIDLSTVNQMHQPGPNAATIADNYATMFEVHHVGGQ